jgi:hypothetical protein
MDVESSPLVPDVTTRFRRLVGHDKGGVFLTLGVFDGNLLDWHAGDLLQAPEGEGQLHIPEAPSFNKPDRPINHLEIECRDRVAGPSVGTLEVKAGDPVSQKCSHLHLNLQYYLRFNSAKHHQCQHCFWPEMGHFWSFRPTQGTILTHLA